MSNKYTKWIKTGYRQVLAVVLLICMTSPPLAAAGRTRSADVESFRGELHDYFHNIHQFAPSVFGELQKSAVALKATHEQIDLLSAEELNAMRELFNMVPSWQYVPSLLSASLPTDVRESIDQVGSFTADQLDGLEGFRSELTRVNTVLSLLPKDTLARFGQTPERLRQAGQIYRDARPAALFGMRSKFDANPGWKQMVDILNSRLSPEAEEAVRALVAEGGLSAEDQTELEAFRDRLTGFFSGLQLLQTDQEIDTDQIDKAIDALQKMEPEMLYLVKHRVSHHPEWSSLPGQLSDRLSDDDSTTLQALVRTGPLTAEKKQELSHFRDELNQFYTQLQTVGLEADSAARAQHRLNDYNYAQLAIAQSKMRQIPGWQALPAFVSITQSVSQVEPVPFQGSPFKTDDLSLSFFRSQMQDELSALSTQRQSGASAATIDQVSESQLELYYQVYSQTPTELAAPMRSLMAATIGSPGGPSAAIGSCFGTSNVDVCPELCLAGACINPTCNVPLPTINFTCIGNEIAASVNAATNQLTAAIDSVTGSISSLTNDILGGINNAINSVSGIATQIANTATGMVGDITSFANSVAADINSFVGDVVSGVTNLVAQIEGAINSLPGAFVGFLGNIVDNALSAVGLNLNTLTPEGMINMLSGAVVAAVDNLPTLPDLPCPPDESTLPGFGTVNDGETHLKYQQYLWVFQTLTELIPESEYTASILVPLNIAAVGFDYIGRCVEHAGERADEADTEEFRELVLESFDNLSAQIMAMETDLTDNLTQTESELTEQLNEARANLLAELDLTEGDVTTQIDLSETNLQERLILARANLLALINLRTSQLDSSLSNATQSLESAVDNSKQSLDAALAAFEANVGSRFSEESEFIETSFRDQTELMTRILIEKQLLDESGKADALVSFAFPEDLGGFLESVRFIVQDTIQMFSSIGVVMDKGLQKDYAAAEQHFADGAHLEAYELYAGIYRGLTK